MASTLFGFQLTSRDDPLANVKSLRAWLVQLPGKDPVGALEVIIRLLVADAAMRRPVSASRLQAMMELDRISVPLQAQLRMQYRTAAMSDDVRQRLWRACDDLAHWFAHDYEEIYKATRVPGENTKVRAELHGIFARMFYYIGVKARQGLFRYEQWIPAKWLMLHSAYREACEQGVAAEPFALDESTRPPERLSPEQEYMQILLLQRLNTGSLTARQIDWAAEGLRSWAPLLRLAVTPVGGSGYWLDLGHGEGLLSRPPQPAAGEVLYLDMEPLLAQLREFIVHLAAQAAASPARQDLAEQLVLARLLERLWLPGAPALARRGERHAVQDRVTAASGWAEITIALAGKVVRSATLPQGYNYDDYGRLRSSSEIKRDAAASRKPDPNAWLVQDTSDSGCRLRCPARLGARQFPGALLALQSPDAPGWQLAIVRRIKKVNAEQTELGVEIISREVSLITPREIDAKASGYSVDGVDIGEKGKTFTALFVPPRVDSRATSAPSLVMQPAEYVPGRLLSLPIGGRNYQICLAPPLELAKDWVWSPVQLMR